jgi:hypothetical protein
MRRLKERAAGSTRAKGLVLLGVLAALALAGGLVAWATGAFAAGNPPAPAITASPPNPTNLTTAAFSFTDSQGGVSFQCKLDGAAYAGCTSPVSYSGLTAGAHQFRVQALSGSNKSPETTFSWTVDLTPPAAPTISAKPTDPTNQTTASFTFNGEAGATFQCKLDTGAFNACTSPQTYSGLGAATHTFAVKAVDAAGNAGPATSSTWTVDLTPPPAPSLTSTPPSVSPDNKPSFSFTDGEAGATFVCQLDGSAFTACTSPKSYGGLADGMHTFAVEAVDAAGNVSTPTSFTWSVNATAPPQPTLAGRPQDVNPSTSATFVFADDEAGVTYVCKLDSGTFVACSNPKTYTGLVLGDHHIDVEAVDSAGHVSSPVAFHWKIVAGNGDLTISGNAAGKLYPGGSARPLAVTFVNPNSADVVATSLTVTLAPGTLPPGCSAADFVLTQSNVSTVNPVTIPANGSVTLPDSTHAPGVNPPTIQMLDHGNQGACAGATFTFNYASS